MIQDTVLGHRSMLIASVWIWWALYKPVLSSSSASSLFIILAIIIPWTVVRVLVANCFHATGGYVSCACVSRVHYDVLFLHHHRHHHHHHHPAHTLTQTPVSLHYFIMFYFSLLSPPFPSDLLVEYFVYLYHQYRVFLPL